MSQLSIESPQLQDIEELLGLYSLIYGRNYPLAYGNDPEEMAYAIESPDYQWLIMRDENNGPIVGSVVFELDRANKLGKCSALVVHPEYQGAGIASQLVSYGDQLIAPDGILNSIYTTTRTRSVGPQLVFLREGYTPLGIFPNAHKLRWRETTTLMAKFKPGVLERRIQIDHLPNKLIPLYEVVHEKLSLGVRIPSTAPPSVKPFKKQPYDELSEFESIYAPQYVLRRFEREIDVEGQFYPFHTPNMLLAEISGKIEIFTYLNKADGYCTLIACSHPMYEIEDFIPALLEELHSMGVSFVEVLIPTDRYQSIDTLLRSQFLPSGLYPAMREIDGHTHDYVVLTRTMEPLNFRGMSIDQTFKPYIDQYVSLWKKMNLDTLEVFNDYKRAPSPESEDDAEHSEPVRT
jgi:GNAT superfamily N-acetyltransferase